MHFICKPVFTDGKVNEDVIISKPFGNDKMTCREIRRNSAGCIKLKEECEKCKEIQHIGKCNIKMPRFHVILSNTELTIFWSQFGILIREITVI